MHHGDGVQRWQGYSGVLGKVLDHRDEPLGGGATRKACAGHDRERKIGVRQSDAASRATGVDEENLHSGAASRGGFESPGACESPTISRRIPPVLAGWM